MGAWIGVWMGVWMGVYMAWRCDEGGTKVGTEAWRWCVLVY